MPEQGYPTEEELDRIEHWDGTLGEMFEFAASIWSSYGHVQKETTPHRNPEAQTTTYAFVTGGWSGNESIISAISRNGFAQFTVWESTHRGGLHIYSGTPRRWAMKLNGESLDELVAKKTAQEQA